MRIRNRTKVYFEYALLRGSVSLCVFSGFNHTFIFVGSIFLFLLGCFCLFYLGKYFHSTIVFCEVIICSFEVAR